MRLSGFLHCTDCPKERFNALRRHDNLPLFSPGADAGGWQSFTLDDAFRFRLMLDFLGDSVADAAYLQGLPPSGAVKIVDNVMPRFDRHPLNFKGSGELWAGIVVFEEAIEDADPLRSAAWFAGQPSDLSQWIEDKRTGGHTGKKCEVVRIFLANASRAASFVRQRAIDLGLPEGMDFSGTTE
jgi:hypothetical protein